MVENGGSFWGVLCILSHSILFFVCVTSNISNLQTSCSITLPRWRGQCMVELRSEAYQKRASSKMLATSCLIATPYHAMQCLFPLLTSSLKLKEQINITEPESGHAVIVALPTATTAGDTSTHCNKQQAVWPTSRNTLAMSALIHTAKTCWILLG